MTKRILLVDDECSIRESLRKILRAENYEVLLAENGQEVVEKYGAERIDLLILDLNMPVKNGWDTLKWLAEINPLLPVVIITGHSNQRALVESAGAAALMEKPLDVPLLLQTIRELIDEPKESRAQRARDRASISGSTSSDNQSLPETLLKRRLTPPPLSEPKLQARTATMSRVEPEDLSRFEGEGGRQVPEQRGEDGCLAKTST